jgi:Fe2+ transport system protein FeoA
MSDRLATSWASARGQVCDLVHGVLFEQPCAVEVEDAVIAQRGNIVHTTQPRGQKSKNAYSERVRVVGTSEAAQGVPIAGVKKAMGALNPKARGGWKMGRTFGKSSPGCVTIGGGRIPAFRGLSILLLACWLSAGARPLIEGGIWASARGQVCDLVHGVLFEQPCAVEVEDAVIAQRGNIVHTTQPR